MSGDGKQILLGCNFLIHVFSDDRNVDEVIKGALCKFNIVAESWLTHG